MRTPGRGANHFPAAHAPLYLSPPAADAQRSRPITAGLPACDGRFVGEGNGCILTWLFEKCQPLTVWSSAERLLARCEHAQQRRSSRHGNIARLYAGCSPPQTPPHPTPHPYLPFLDHPNVSFIFVSQNTTNVRESIIFVWKMYQICECAA